MHSAECRFLSQVTFESPQFTNLYNSIDIADRIGELYAVDSYICICRFGILLWQMRNKILPLRPTMAAVTEVVLSELTGNSDFVSMVEAMTKCGPILDRVK